MRAFRIARKPMGPWANLTPPIRGGPHRHLGHLADREDTESPLAGTITPAVTITPPPVLSLSGNDAAADAPLLRRRVSAAPPSIAGSTTDDSSNTSDSGSSPPGSPSSLATTALDDIDDPNEPPKDPAKYVDWAVDQGVDKALREYPSLDLQVQQAIVRRYRQLHQDVRDQGLYECRYIEYGKEMVRYTTLFVLFLVFLRWGWYTVSAACLGFFWVCLTSALTIRYHSMLTVAV
jgi:sphingolipid 8-(E)-desaturase